MNITLTGTKVVIDDKILAFEKDNKTASITLTADTTSDWAYSLYVEYPKDGCGGDQLYNIIILPRVNDVYMVEVLSTMLPFNGKYAMQLRGTKGDKVYHSDTFEAWVRRSIDPSEIYDPLPSAFDQAIEQLNELNTHPPYPNGATGYWMIWNVGTHSYKQSTLPTGATLPTITPQTAGKFLTNDGTSAIWADNVGDKTFVFTQSIAASTWNVAHNMGKYPSVTIVDSGDNWVVGDVQYVSANALTITFTSAFSGKAYLN